MEGLLQGYSLCAVITQRLHQTCILCFALHRIKVVLLEILYVGLQQCYYFPTFPFCSQDLQKFLISFLFFYQPARSHFYSEVKAHPKVKGNPNSENRIWRWFEFTSDVLQCQVLDVSDSDYSKKSKKKTWCNRENLLLFCYFWPNKKPCQEWLITTK